MEQSQTPSSPYPPILIKVINLIMIGYAIITLFRFILFDLLLQQFDYRSYAITDWLINYQSGYVRRGLLGELIFHVSKATELSPVFFILLFSTSSFIIVTYLLFKQLKKRDICWWILPLNICLSGAVFLRKDYICILFIIASIIAYVKINNTWLRLCTINLILCITLNFHESVIFIIGPFMALAIWNDKRVHASPWLKSLFFAPTAICFLIISLFKGDASIAQAIHDSWGIPKMGLSPTATIESLSWSIEHAIHFHIHENFLSSEYPIYGKIEKPLLWLLTFIITPCILFCRKVFPHTTTRNFIHVLLLQFISLFPMLTVLSCDQSRIFFYWTFSSICIFIFIPEKMLTCIFPSFYTSISSYAHKIALNKISRACAIPLLLIIAISPYSTRPKLACVYSVAGSYATSIIIIKEITPIILQQNSAQNIISTCKKEIIPIVKKIIK